VNSVSIVDIAAGTESVEAEFADVISTVLPETSTASSLTSPSSAALPPLLLPSPPHPTTAASISIASAKEAIRLNVTVFITCYRRFPVRI
jgi:hypothetical protein